MIQYSSPGYTPRTEEPNMSNRHLHNLLKHNSQCPRYEINLSVHQYMNGKKMNSIPQDYCSAIKVWKSSHKNEYIVGH